MRLSTKVLAALVAVVFVGLATASLLISRTAGNAYQIYLRGYEQQQLAQLAEEAAVLYAATASWAEVHRRLTASAQSATPSRSNSAMPNQGRGQRRMGQQSIGPLYIVDPRTGESLTDDGFEDSIALATASIVVDGQVVAALAIEPTMMTMGSPEETLTNNVTRAILLSALIAGAVAVLVGWLLVASILRPLRRLGDGVAQVADGDLQVRVDAHGNDEIAQLTSNFNRMAENLQTQEDLRQRLVSDIAHELRTPLTVIEGNLQAIIDGVYPLSVDELRNVAAETRHMARLVADLHELAQAEAGRLPLMLQHVDVNVVLTHMASVFRPLADERGLIIEVQPSPDEPAVHIDPDRLHQVLTNLLVNALHHSPRGGSMRLSSEITGNKVRIAVGNEGPGISSEALPHVYDRFYRGKNAGSESGAGRAGLGLAIVKALVELQGGTVGVESTPGETVFWFDLPAVVGALDVER